MGRCGGSAYHKIIGDFKLAGNPIKMSSYKDEKTRGDIPDLDEHREKILKELLFLVSVGRILDRR